MYIEVNTLLIDGKGVAGCLQAYNNNYYTQCDYYIFLQLFVVNTATDSLLDIPRLRLEGSASISTSCGIHTIGASEERRYLATGGADPTHLAIYGLPEMQPLAIGEVGILCCA